MNPKALHPIRTLFLMGFQAAPLVLAFWCTPAQAQIDFSVLDKYRGIQNQRPADWNSGTEKPPGGPSKRDRPPSREELKRWADRQKLAGTQKQQIKGELARLSRGYQIQRAQPTIELAPRGSDIFDISHDSGKRPFGQIMVASLSGIGTPATRIPVENLRRAAAIMQTFLPGNMGTMSEEDMSYLASQSALAMEGAPLSVEIRDLPVGREEDVRRLIEQVQDIETVRAEAERATTERLRVEEQLVKAQKDLQSGRGDTEALKLQREIVLRSYKAAYNAEANKKAQVQDMTGKVTRVWH